MPGSTRVTASTGLTVSTSPDPTTRLRLEGRAVLVTGGSRGLGLAIADVLHALGAEVYATSRQADDAAALAERYGTTAVELDVGDPESIDQAMATVIDAAPHLDLLVNNAGINAPEPAEDLQQANWDSIYDINVRGLFLASQAFARHLIANKRPGAICNISSQAGRVAIVDRAAYSSSKAAVDQLTRSLAYEWGPHGIRVNAVAPTFVRTEFTEASLSKPGFSEKMLGNIPLGRFGEPVEVADAVAFALSDMSTMMTGHTLVIDGGFTIH